MKPPPQMPSAIPLICPIRKRASTGCLRSYGTTSPIQAIASGITAAAVAPAASRATSSAA